MAAGYKGQGFERDMCRMLSLWWSDQKQDDIFWRQRVKITSKTPHAERQLGDICAAHSNGLSFVEMFNVEMKTGYSKTTSKQAKKDNDKLNAERAKKGKEPVPMTVRNTPWDLLELIDSKKMDDNLDIIKFWNQCKSDAELSGRIPLLIFKRDFHLPVVCIEEIDFEGFSDLIGTPNVRKLILVDKDKKMLTFYRLEHFFGWLDPIIVKLAHGIKCKNKELANG